MQITHKKIPTVDDKVGLDDWTDLHDVDLSGTIRVPVLVGSYTVDSGSAYKEITGLNGDADEEWLMVYDGVLSVNDGSINMIFNNDTGSNYTSTAWIQRQDASTEWGKNFNSLIITGTPWNIGTPRTHFEVLMQVKSGNRRVYRCESTGVGSTYALRIEGFGGWKNTADNITRLKLTCSNGSFAGLIKIYKMVDLVL